MSTPVLPVTASPPMPVGLLAVRSRIAELSGRATFTTALTTAAGSLGTTGETAVPAGSTTAGSTTAGPTTAGSIVADAMQYVGTDYQWGGESPATGFDCSGLIQWVFRQHGVELPRVAADQARAGSPVAPGQAQAGDLVFFGSPVDHCGIYLGNGLMLNAPHTGAQVRVEKVDLTSCTAIRRVLPQATAGGWAAALPAQGKQYAGLIQQAADAEGVDPALLAALAWQESGFRADAVSPAGARGLVQLMPATARGMGVNPDDPAQALAGGARYLKTQLDRFGSPDLALAAYNAGPTAVRTAGAVPDYPETQAYVRAVLALRDRLAGGRA